jgi:hypothetical protein
VTIWSAGHYRYDFIRMNRFILFLASIAMLASCSKEKSAQSLPPATGISGDVYLVMDSLQWEGPLGDLLDSVFNAEMRGLPREESIFRTRWIDPRKLNFVLKQRRNIIFVTTLDGRGPGSSTLRKLYSPESLEKIKTDTSLFVTTQANLFANGQEVMFLFARTEKELMDKVSRNSPRLVDFFNKTEISRLAKSLMKSGRLKGMSSWLQQNYQADLHVPFGYKLVERNPDFCWVRQMNPRDDRNVFIARAPYTSQEQFTKEKLIEFRNQVCQKYLFEDPDVSDSYLVTETEVPFIPVEARKVSFNNHFGVELRGLWRTNTKSMGGPFLGFAMVDEGTQQFYYIEGFTFSPDREQREIMRELEAIIFTFRLSGEIPKESPEKTAP